MALAACGLFFLALLGLSRQTECEIYDYLNFRTVQIDDTDVANMNFVYADDNIRTYLSICTPLHSSIVAQAEGLDPNLKYNFISCDKNDCFGLTPNQIITALPRIYGVNNYTVRLVYKHPRDNLPLIVSFPDLSIQVNASGLNQTVLYSRVEDNNEEYEPIAFHNYSFRAKADPKIQIIDTYLFGSQHYFNSWVWAVVGVSFMLSSACFHNFATTSGRLSSFTFFIYFYTFYRIIDTFYCVAYTPPALIATSSVIIFPGVAAYVLTNLDRMDINYYAFCTPRSPRRLLPRCLLRRSRLLPLQRLLLRRHRGAPLRPAHLRLLPLLAAALRVEDQHDRRHEPLHQQLLRHLALHHLRPAAPRCPENTGQLRTPR